jgi:hypothetical protein
MSGPGPTVLASGNIAATYLLSVSLTPSAVGAGAVATQTFTIPGLLAGDEVSGIELQGGWTNLTTIANAWVSANNTLSVSFQNTTAGSLTPPAGTYYLEINRPAFPGPQPPIIQ